jgi:uncharacterized membrane protein YkoI
MKTSTKLIMVGALVGLAATVRLVHAAQSQAPVALMTEHHTANLIAQASDGDGETKDDAKGQSGDKEDDAEDKIADQKESTKLQPLAKISSRQAQQAAESAQGGQAKAVKLENEDGNLVYSVEIGNQEVTIDAGNGKVLYAEAANQDHKSKEVNYPRSSIQVSESPTGDGEINDDG